MRKPLSPYQYVKYPDGRHRWKSDRQVTGKSGGERIYYTCRVCHIRVFTETIDTDVLIYLTRKHFIPELRKMLDKPSPLLTRLMETKRKKFPAVFSKRHQEV